MEQPSSEPQPQPEQAQPVTEQPPVDPMEAFLTLTEEEKNISPEIISDIISYLYTNGLILKTKPLGVNHLPIILYPNALPKKLFEKIFFYQIAFNKILNKLSEDQEYLEKILDPLSSQDAFIQKLLSISKKSLNYEHKQKIKLNILRNDYLYDKNQKFLFLKQFNSINGINFGTFTDKMKVFYEYFKTLLPKVFEKYKDKEIPMNKGDCVEKFSESIIEAIKLAFSQKPEDTLIVFVINKEDNNIFDRQAIINELYKKIKIHSKQMTLSEIKNNCTQDENGNLVIDNKTISMFYFCAGDKEKDYPDEESWQAREMIELSTAIKVPDVNSFLVTLKVFQYLLSRPDLAMHYCHNELILNDILRFYGGIYYVKEMEKDKQKDLFEKIKQDPGKFKLIPLREKEGGELEGEELKNILPEGENEPGENLIQGVIVEKIDSPEHETMSIINEKSEVQNYISEYSVYGIILTNDKNLQTNKSVSYLIRTMNKNLQDKGNILEGTAAVDLPCLIDVKVEPNLTHKVEVTAEEIQKYLDDLKAAEEAKKKAEEEEAKRKAEEEEAKKKAEEEEAKKKAEEAASNTEQKPEEEEVPKTEE